MPSDDGDFAGRSVLLRAVIELAGDRETEEMLDLYHVRGLSHEAIARKYGVTRSCVTKKMNKMRGRLARLGVLPHRWNR